MSVIKPDGQSDVLDSSANDTIQFTTNQGNSPEDLFAKGNSPNIGEPDKKVPGELFDMQKASSTPADGGWAANFDTNKPADDDDFDDFVDSTPAADPVTDAVTKPQEETGPKIEFPTVSDDQAITPPSTDLFKVEKRVEESVSAPPQADATSPNLFTNQGEQPNWAGSDF